MNIQTKQACEMPGMLFGKQDRAQLTPPQLKVGPGTFWKHTFWKYNFGNTHSENTFLQKICTFTKSTHLVNRLQGM